VSCARFTGGIQSLADGRSRGEIAGNDAGLMDDEAADGFAQRIVALAGRYGHA
jgi:hypothetical protein